MGHAQNITNAEERVLAEPSNSEHYYPLLSAYMEETDFLANPKRIHYIKEVIQRFPEHWICQTPFVHLNPELSLNEYNQVEALWISLLDEKPNNIQIVKGVANFYSCHELHKSCDILKQALKKTPESHDLWFHLSRYTRDEKKRLSYLLKAEQYGSKQPNLIVWIADNAVITEEFNIAQSYAEQLLSLIKEAEATYGDKLNWRGESKVLDEKALDIMEKDDA